MHLPIDPAVACPFATRYSLFATRYSLLAIRYRFAFPQNPHQPFNGFTDFAPFSVQLLWVTLVIGLDADEAIKQC